MVLHTIIPMEAVMAQQNDIPSARPTAKMVNGYLLEGIEQNDGFEVTGILSTDLRAYLDERVQPGCRIKYGENSGD